MNENLHTRLTRGEMCPCEIVSDYYHFWKTHTHPPFPPPVRRFPSERTEKQAPFFVSPPLCNRMDEPVLKVGKYWQFLSHELHVSDIVGLDGVTVT